MKRHGLHNTLLILATLVFAVCCFWQTISHNVTGILWTCGSYALFLALFYIIARILVPASRRNSPVLPTDFTSLRLGIPSPETSRKLDSFALEKEQKFNGILHTLHRTEKHFPQGVWICEVETTNGEIIAISRRFESSVSQLFDQGKEMGQGRIIVSNTTV